MLLAQSTKAIPLENKPYFLSPQQITYRQYESLFETDDDIELIFDVDYGMELL